MIKLICSSQGSRRVRVRVLHRQITVRHRFSETLLKKLKTDIEQDDVHDIEGLSLDAGSFEQSVVSLPNPGAFPRVEPVNEDAGRVQLPRLSAFLDQNRAKQLAPEVNPPPERTYEARPPGSRARNRKNPSAYEVLRARWDRTQDVVK